MREEWKGCKGEDKGGDADRARRGRRGESQGLRNLREGKRRDEEEEKEENGRETKGGVDRGRRGG